MATIENNIRILFIPLCVLVPVSSLFCSFFHPHSQTFIFYSSLKSIHSYIHPSICVLFSIHPFYNLSIHVFILVCLSIHRHHIFIYPSIQPFIHLSINLYVHPPIDLPHPFKHLSIYPHILSFIDNFLIFPSVYTHPSIHPSIHQYDHQSYYPSVYRCGFFYYCYLLCFRVC